MLGVMSAALPSWRFSTKIQLWRTFPDKQALSIGNILIAANFG